MLLEPNVGECLDTLWVTDLLICSETYLYMPALEEFDNILQSLTQCRDAHLRMAVGFGV